MSVIFFFAEAATLLVSNFSAHILPKIGSFGLLKMSDINIHQEDYVGLIVNQKLFDNLDNSIFDTSHTFLYIQLVFKFYTEKALSCVLRY